MKRKSIKKIFNRNIFLFVICFFVLSCNNKTKNKEIKDDNILSIFGKKIDLLSNLPVYNPIIDYIINKKTIEPKVRVVTRIDGNCFSCSQKLLDWKDFIDEQDLNNLDFRIYLDIHDFSTLRPYFKMWRFKHPIIIDKDNSFQNINKVSELHQHETFLLYKKNQIVLIGNPLKNNKLKSLYQKAIDSLKLENF